MIAALAALALLSQPAVCGTLDDVSASVSPISTGSVFVSRGSTVEEWVRVDNRGPVSYPRVAVTVRVDSRDRVAKLDTMPVEVTDGGPWRRLDHSVGSPDSAFVAPLGEFPLAAGGSRVFMIRMHFGAEQGGQIRSSAVLDVGAGACPVREGQYADWVLILPEPGTDYGSVLLLALIGLFAGALPVLVLGLRTRTRNMRT